MRLESEDRQRLAPSAVDGPWADLLGYYPAWLAYRRWYLRIPGVQVALREDGASALAAGYVHLLSLGRSAEHAVTEPSAAKFTGRFASLWGFRIPTDSETVVGH